MSRRALTHDPELDGPLWRGCRKRLSILTWSTALGLVVATVAILFGHPILTGIALSGIAVNALVAVTLCHWQERELKQVADDVAAARRVVHVRFDLSDTTVYQQNYAAFADEDDEVDPDYALYAAAGGQRQ
jgi:hypothetical protein